jgi:hypothetical protein
MLRRNKRCVKTAAAAAATTTSDINIFTVKFFTIISDETQTQSYATITNARPFQPRASKRGEETTKEAKEGGICVRAPTAATTLSNRERRKEGRKLRIYDTT